MIRAMDSRRRNDRDAVMMRSADHYEICLDAFKADPVRRRAPEPVATPESMTGPSLLDQIKGLLAPLQAQLSEQGTAIAAIQASRKPGPKAPPPAPESEKGA